MSENLKFLSKVFIALFFTVIIFCTFTYCAAYKAKICRECVLKQTTKDSTGTPVATYTPYDTLALISRHKAPDQVFNNCDSIINALRRSPDSTLTTKQNGVKSTVSGKGGKITVLCETDSLKAVITLLRSRIDTPHYTTVTEQVPARCERDHLTKMDSFWTITGRCLLGLIGLALVGVYLKRFI